MTGERDDGAEIEVTPEMVAAGVDELWNHYESWGGDGGMYIPDKERLVRMVFIEMSRERPDASQPRTA